MVKWIEMVFNWMEVAGRAVLDGWFCWFLIFLSKNARLFVIFVDTCITNGYNLLFACCYLMERYYE